MKADVAILVIGIFGILSELHALRVIRRIGSQLSLPLRILVWARRIAFISVLVSAILSLVATRLESPLWIAFEVSLVVWLASTLGYWIVRLTVQNKILSKST